MLKKLIVLFPFFIQSLGLQAQKDLSELFSPYAYDLEIRDGKLRGPGAELLLFEATRSDFFMIGEDPGVAEIPAFCTAIYRHAYNIGLRFTHFSIETGLLQAHRLENIAIDASAKRLLEEFFKKNPGETPFYELREEADLLKEVMAIAESNEEILWGLDIDQDKISRFALNELIKISPDQEVDKLLEKEIKLADKAFDKYKTNGVRTGLYIYQLKPELIEKLKEAFADDPVAIHLIKTLQTSSLYWKKLSEQDLRSAIGIRNKWMQDQFRYYYDYALSNEPKTPKVMFKLRAAHLYRGNIPGRRIPSLGKNLSNYAEEKAFRTFNVRVMPGKGSKRLIQQMDMSFQEDSTSEVNATWMEPLANLALDKWKVFELKAIRNKITGRNVPAALRKLIEEYDALIIMGGSTPSSKF